MAEAAAPTEQTPAPAPAEGAAPAEAKTLLGGDAEATKSDDVLLAGAEDGDGGAEKKDADGASTVPEEYAFEVPDDLKEIVKDENVAAMLKEFGPTAKELGLSQDQFQKLVEFDARRAQAATEEGALSYHQRVQDWGQQVKDDQTFGGPNLDQNLKLAELGLEKLGTSGLRQLLKPPSADNPEGMGLGNHPEILRLLRNVGKLYKEPNLVVGQPDAAETDRTRLQRMYPTMFPKAS